MIVAITLAVLAGVSRTVGRMTNARLAGYVGLIWSTFANYLVGLLCSLLALALTRYQRADLMPAASLVPAWAYGGAVVGVLFVLGSNVATSRMSAFAMSVLLVLGQLAAGLVIDGVIGAPRSVGKIIGCALILTSLLANRGTPQHRRRAAPRSQAPDLSDESH